MNYGTAEIAPPTAVANSQPRSIDVGAAHDQVLEKEVEEVRSRLAKVESIFRAMESANTEKVRDIDDPRGRGIVLTIKEQTPEQYDSCLKTLSDTMQGVSEAAKDATFELRTRLFQLYTQFKYPFRVVTGVFPKDGKARYAVIYADRPEDVTITADGSVDMGGRSMTAEVPDASRYGYLFEQELGGHK